jgi:hypothetical protein
LWIKTAPPVRVSPQSPTLHLVAERFSPPSPILTSKEIMALISVFVKSFYIAIPRFRKSACAGWFGDFRRLRRDPRDIALGRDSPGFAQAPDKVE